ncbi:MAG: hypothetical protein WKF96_16120 [Solirubrobacteraceae bacterium]
MASPLRRRIVRVIVRSRRPIDLDRSRTATPACPIALTSLRPSRASDLTPCAAKPASVGYLMSASMTVESILTALAQKRFSRTADSINVRMISLTVCSPTRLVSLRTVDSSHTTSLSAIRQKRRR